MSQYVCFGCHYNLIRISNRRLMCFSCEKIYAEDFLCRQCSARQRTKVFMEVIAPGKVKCILCGNEKDAPGLNLDTMMKRDSIARMGKKKETSFPIRSIPSKTLARRNRIADAFFKSGHPGGNRKQSLHLAGFPLRPAPDVLEDKDGLIVVVEFPGHKGEKDIKIIIEAGKLYLKSRLEECLYSNEVALPGWAKEPKVVNFQNGILEIRFQKKQNQT